MHWTYLKYYFLLFLVLGLSGFTCKPNSGSAKGTDPDQGKPYSGIIQLKFEDYGSKELFNIDYIKTVTLIKYSEEPQDPGVEIKRWEGDTSGKYKYVEVERRVLNLKDYINWTLLLETGLYQIKHNSVTGNPPSGYYGDSEFFEIHVGDKPQEIRIVLYPAI